MSFLQKDLHQGGIGSPRGKRNVGEPLCACLPVGRGSSRGRPRLRAEGLQRAGAESRPYETHLNADAIYIGFHICSKREPEE